MNVMQTFKRLTSAVTLVATAATMLLASGHAAAIPYQGDSTPALDHPGFNVYTGTPSVGDESNFFTGKESSATGYTNPVSSLCQDGTEYTLRVYVHNGASTSLNQDGNGPGVARNTVVRVGLNNNGVKTSFPMNATISASNAATVSDDLTLNCNGHPVTLSYLAGTAEQYTVPGGTQKLSDSIVTSGAPIGTVKPDGNVWGCWDQRVWVTLKVKVAAQPVPPVSSGECKVVDVVTKPNRTVTATVTGQATNATIVGYQIDFGDGTVSNKQTETHTYAKDGTYTIVTKVQVQYPNGSTEWKTATACTKQVTFQNGTPVPPVTPPSVIPNTGAGNVIAAFVASSIIGMLGYRAYLGRRARQQ